jgi:hypothetical protein
MAYLNEQERDALLNELKNMSFRQAQGKLRSMDEKSRLAYFRNAQQTGRWLTRYVLPSLGTRVTLVEVHSDKPTNKERRLKSEYEFVEVIVEPTPDNRN